MVWIIICLGCAIKKPRNYTDMGEHISSKTMEAYDSDLIANKITDLMMFVLKHSNKRVIK